MEQNELIKNLYINPIPDETKKYKLSKNLRIKGGKPQNAITNSLPALPSLLTNKGGSVIIQNWNTKSDIPAEVDNLNLPIIIDRGKVKNGLPEIKERGDNDKNKKDEFSKWKVIENGEKFLLEKGNPSNVNSTRKLGKVSNNELPSANQSSSKTSEVALKEVKEKEQGLVPFDGKEKEEEKKAVVVKKWNNRPIIDFSTFIKHEYLTDNEFLYCKRVGNPIEFIECVYSELVSKDKKKKGKTRPIKEYITVSKNTVMHYQNGNSSVYSVVMWKDFYIKFKRLLEIPLFKNFRTAKLFDLWRRFLKKTRKTLFTEKLKKKFHHIDESLLKGFMEIRKILKGMVKVNIFKIENKEAITINKFQELHKIGLKELDKTIEQYRSEVKKEITKACGASYQKYKELKKITLEDNAVGTTKKDKKDDIEEGMNMVQKQKSQKEKLEEENQFVQNFLKDAMPYAQDATRRTHYKKLLRYIRVIDFLFNNAKYDLIKNSMNLLSNKLHKMYTSNFLNNQPETPMIVAFISPVRDQIKFNPHIELIKKSLYDEFILEKIYTVIYRKSFMDPQEFQNYMVCFEEVFEVSVDQNSNLNLRIKEDPSINAIFDNIKESVNKCFAAMDEYCAELTPTLKNFNKFNNIKFEALQEDAKPEELKDFLEKFAAEGVEIAKIRQKKNMGIFEFTLENLIELVQNAPAYWLTTMRDLIPKLLINKLRSLIQILNSYIKRLSIQVVDVETFINLKESVREILENKEKIDNRNNEIIDIINITKDDPEIKIPEYDFKMIREKESLYVEFEKKLDNMVYYLENNLSKYRNELKININRFDKDIRNMMDELNVDILNNYNEDNYSAIFYIEDKSGRIRKLIDKKEFFIDQENKIEIEDNSDFENLENLVYDYELKSKLWYSVREYQDMSKKWEVSQVQKIDLVEMEDFIKKWAEVGETAKIDLESQNVPLALLENLKVFKQILPVLKTFQNPNITEKFVEMIKEELDIEYSFDYPEFTVRRLIDLPDITEKVSEIVEINVNADEENRIRNIYQEVIESYNKHKLPKSKHINTKQQGDKGADRYTISDSDLQVEYEFIEEKLLILKQLILNPYSTDLQKDIVELVTNFNKYLNFLDEFSSYQRFITSTEPVVFFNPEFSKEMANEYKKFNNENALKNHTKTLRDPTLSQLPNYIKSSHEKVINDLRRGNKNYEELFKFIEEYLDRKRRETSKYYYLSNDELLEMYQKMDDIEVKRKHLPKMISGIKNVDLGSENDENIKIITLDEENITFKYSKGKGNIKELLDAIETEIAKKLKTCFKTFKRDFHASTKSNNKDNIIKKPKDLIVELVKNHENLGQAIFNFVYSYYIEQLEKALNQEDAFDKIMDFHEDSKSRKEYFAQSLKDLNSNKVEKRILMNLISLESFFKNIIKTLVREDVVSTSDFNWLKYLHIKIDGENCNLRIFNIEMEYGYEYVGLQNNFIVSPMTERMYISLATCAEDKKPFILYGLPESGKKETLLSFSKILGKSLYIYKCSPYSDQKAFHKILYGGQKAGNWILLDNIDLVDRELLSAIAQDILQVHWNINDPKADFYLPYDKIPINHSTRIMCTTRLVKKNNIDILPENIKSSFRFIGQSTPDLFFIIHSTMKNLAFPRCKYYARKIKYILEYLNSKISLLKYKRIGLNLFKKLIRRLERSSNRVNKENADDIIRRAIEKIFVPFMDDDENDDMMKTLNYVFNHSHSEVFTYGSTLNSEINDVIDEVTKNSQFSNINFKNRIKSILSSIEEKDSYIFTGPCLSGKSQAMVITEKVTQILNNQNIYENPLMKYIKIFPKSFSPMYIFSDVDRYSQLQFFNNYFANKLALLQKPNQTEEERANNRMKSSAFNFDANKQDEVQEKESIKVLCFDGLIDPTWVEYLNMINDETKTQCLANGDIIKLNNYKIVFETDNLNYCTPSFITKNYVVHFDAETLTWENMLFDFIAKNPKVNANNDLKNYIRGLYENYFPKIYEFIMSSKSIAFNFRENYVLKNLISLFDSILPEYDFSDRKLGRRNLDRVSRIDIIKKSTLSIFIFSCAWTVMFFTNFIMKSKAEKLISDIFKVDDLRGPIFDYYINEETHKFAAWEDKIENEMMPEKRKKQEEIRKDFNGQYLYDKVFIPTVDTVSYQYILKKYITAGHPIFYTGKVGVGKTALINDLLNEMDANRDEVFVLRYLINYNSSPKKIENCILDNLKYVKRDLIGDLYNRRVVFFVDDCNLQKADKFNSQNCIEYLRQLSITNYIYEMKTNVVKTLDKFLTLAVGNLSAYGKNPNIDRYIHNCVLISQGALSDESLSFIFKPLFEAHLRTYIPNTSAITSNQYVQGCLNLFKFVNEKLTANPQKLHYRFGITDLAKLFQSLIDYNFPKTDFMNNLRHLWYNECFRIYEDRLGGNENDIKLFKKHLLQIYNSALKQNLKADVVYNPQKMLFFGFEVNLPPKQKPIPPEENKEGDKDKNSDKKENEIEMPPDNLEEFETKSPQQLAMVTSFNPRVYTSWPDLNDIRDLYQTKYDEFVKNNKSRQFIMNSDTFKLLVKIIRSMHKNKGNILLITDTLSGKLLLSHFAAFVEGRSFYEIDESITNREQKYLEDYFKKILLETIYKNQEVVIFLNNKMLEKDDLLETLNNLINYRDILSHYDHLKGEGEFKEVKLDDKTKLLRIEKNLSIIMNVIPNSIAYKKLFYNYTYISKNTNIINLEKTSDESLYNLANDTIPEVDEANNKFGKFPKFLLDIHNFMKDLANEYEEKLKFHIEINSKNFIDMVTYYENNFNNFKEHLCSQRAKFEFACELIPKLQEIITKLNEEIVGLEPQINENDKILNEKKSEQIKKLGVKNTISQAKSDDEKPLNLLTNNLERMQETIKENLSESDRKVSTCSAPVGKLEKGELAEYRNIIENHSLSKFLLAQIYSINEENSEWEFIKKNLDPKHFKSLIAKEYHNYPQNIVKIVRDTLAYPEFSVEGLSKNFNITKIFYEWFVAMDGYFTEYEAQKGLFDEIEECNNKIQELEKSIAIKTENLKEVQSQIGELEKSISDIERIKSTVALRMKKRNDLKVICDEFIATANEKNDFWEDKRLTLDKKIENLEFYLAFLACYINYAAAFNNSFRKKIKNFFLEKSEEYGFLSIRSVNFYNIMLEFLDLKKEKEIIINLIPYDEYTKENLLLIHLSKKTPYLIDHNRISKWIIKDFYEKKEMKKTISVKQGDFDMDELLDKSMKEGQCLMIERIDSKIFDTFKNVILDNKFQEKGRTYVSINNVNKEINSKFKLFFVKDKVDSLIDSQMWLESLVINFIPCKEILRGTLIRELLANEGNNLWNVYMNTSTQIFKDNTKLYDLEDKIHQILGAFDFTGNVEKNDSNSGLLERLKNEYVNHTHLIEQIEQNNESLHKYQEDIGKYSLLADEAGKMYKMLSKFTNIDNIYNFGFAVYIKLVKDFYNEKIKQEDNPEAEYTLENLHDLIIYIYDKISMIYSYNERKLLCMSLILFFYQTKGEIDKKSKYILKITKYIFFDNRNDTVKYKEDSPIRPISKHQWNSLLEINAKSEDFLKIFLDHLTHHLEEWTNFLSSDEMILKSNFTFFDQELESSINIFQKFILFAVLKPHLFDQYLDYLRNSLFLDNLKIPKLNIRQALNTVSTRQIFCIIDNHSTCDKEIINHYQAKFMMGETVNVSYETMVLNSELNQTQLDKILNAMKTGNLFLIKEIQHLRNSIYKIIEMLEDTKNVVNDAFRIVFIAKSNIVLPNIVYDKCFILNKNQDEKNFNLKESINELLDNIDVNLFEFAMDRKFNPIFTRKLFFHLLLAHSVLKIYDSFDSNFYNLPYRFNKKDFFYCFKFIKVYLEKIGDKEEAQNNNPNNFNNNNYLSLVNLCIDTFYLNRIMYKEDYAKVSKLMHRYFEDNDFMNEGYLMFYRNSHDKTFMIKNRDATLTDMLEDKYTLNDVINNINFDEMQNIIDNISLESYYDLINNMPYELINNKLSQIGKYYISNLCHMNSILIKSYKNMEVNKLYDIDPEEYLAQITDIKNDLPEKIYFGEEASSIIFKLTKTGEYVNPMDESIKFEVNKYNDFLQKINEDIEMTSRIVKGDILFNDHFNSTIFNLYNKKLPEKWQLHSFLLKKDIHNHVDLHLWMDNIKERFVILRKWLQYGSLEIFPLKLFYNFKLFIFSVLNMFSRKANVTPDDIHLKFFFTKFYPQHSERFLEEKKDIEMQYKDKDIIFVDGIVIENAFYNYKEGKIYENIEENRSENTSEMCPIMGITYELPFVKKDQSFEEQENSMEEETISVPIYCRDDNNDDELFENVEPVGHIELIFDNNFNEDFWITKNIRISSEY